MGAERARKANLYEISYFLLLLTVLSLMIKKSILKKLKDNNKFKKFLQNKLISFLIFFIVIPHIALYEFYVKEGSHFGDGSIFEFDQVLYMSYDLMSYTDLIMYSFIYSIIYFILYNLFTLIRKKIKHNIKNENQSTAKIDTMENK